MKLRYCIGTAMALLSLSGCGKAFYDFGAEALRKDPAIRAEATRDCVKDTQRKSQFERQALASAMKVSLARVPEVFCRRIVGAVASGRITYADLQNDKSDKIMVVLRGG